MHGRMTGGWSASSSHAQSPYTSAFQRIMVRWEDDLQIPLERKQKRLGRSFMVLRGADILKFPKLFHHNFSRRTVAHANNIQAALHIVAF